jgi:hypothetical protein
MEPRELYFSLFQQEIQAFALILVELGFTAIITWPYFMERLSQLKAEFKEAMK